MTEKMTELVDTLKPYDIIEISDLAELSELENVVASIIHPDMTKKTNRCVDKQNPN